MWDGKGWFLHRPATIECRIGVMRFVAAANEKIVRFSSRRSRVKGAISKVSLLPTKCTATQKCMRTWSPGVISSSNGLVMRRQALCGTREGHGRRSNPSRAPRPPRVPATSHSFCQVQRVHVPGQHAGQRFHSFLIERQIKHLFKDLIKSNKI